MPTEYSNFSNPDTVTQDPDADARRAAAEGGGGYWDPETRRWLRPDEATPEQKEAYIHPPGSPGGVNGGAPNPLRVYDPGADEKRYVDMSAPLYTSGPAINRAASNESRGISMDAISLLRQRAEGGMTPAQLLAKQQTAGAVSGIQSGAASVRGGAGARAAAARGAMATTARVGAQGAQDEQALRAREMADGAGSYFGAAGAQRGRDIGVATEQAKLDAGQRGSNEQRGEFYEGLRFGTQKQTLDTKMGRSAEASAAANAARNAGIAEDQASRGRLKDTTGAVIGGVSGGVQAYGQTQQPTKSTDPWDPKNYSGSDERMKTGIRDLSTSDPDAKQAAFELGIKQGVSLASGDNAGMSGPRGKVGESPHGKAAVEKYGRVPPNAPQPEDDRSFLEKGFGAAVDTFDQGIDKAADHIYGKSPAPPNVRQPTSITRGDPMAQANRAMAPSSYEYKPEFAAAEGQEPGEVNVGPMANKMEADPVAKTAIVTDPQTGLMAIDKTKGLKLVMGGLANLQRQVDRMPGARK